MNLKTGLVIALILTVAGVTMHKKSDRINALLKEMSLEEKIELLGGRDNYFTKAIPRLGIPSLKMADGSMGVRNFGMSTAMAGGIGLAATWNTELAERVASEMGRDARVKGVHFLLAPGINIYRSPLSGRNFEYFGEDPFLASRMTVSFIIGVQNQGVSATVKHFAANNSEFDRHNTDSIIDERTLREIYLPAFEAAVKEAKVGAIMDSYNLINHVHATQNNHLSNEIAKKEWGFDGVIMSDWISTYSTEEAAKNGLDLEMPAGKYFNKEKLIPLIKTGVISESLIDDKVARLLSTAERFGWLDREQTDLTISSLNQRGKEVALQSSREGMVLLKNDRHLLPLKQETIKTIAVIGPNAYPAVPVGGGSSRVYPYHSVSFLEGISQYAGDKINVIFSQGIPSLGDMSDDTHFKTTESGNEAGLQAEYFDNPELKGKPIVIRIEQHLNFGDESKISFPEHARSSRWTGYFTPEKPGQYDVFVQTMHEPSGFYRLYIDDKLIFDQWTTTKALLDNTQISLSEGPHQVILEQTEHETAPGTRLKLGIVKSADLLDPEALKKGAMADAVILAVGFNAQSESEGSDRTFSLPIGQNVLIEEIAKVNKNVIVVITSGGNVDMSPWLDHVPAIIQAWYPGQEGGTALAEILFGKVNPSGKLPVTFEKHWEDNPAYNNYYPSLNSNEVPYKEGIFIGYRGYDHNRVLPQFPFGYGLSYTTFHYSDLSIGSLHKQTQITFSIKNTGDVQGAEIAQVYVRALDSTIPRPEKELKGFAKVSLEPGETKRVSVNLDDRSFAYYDVNTNHWVVTPGNYEILVGSSSQQIALNGFVKKTTNN